MQFAVWAMMEAIERLLADGFRPERTIYLAIGHDEELGGWEGPLVGGHPTVAATVAAALTPVRVCACVSL